ncbi:UDP-GlcNAc:betaGal beta-1,3-N-acetylglucosaminyltransferase-like protein 1 [Teleopsis dalmanni]|uniref:UDP-GlcNAc:betaGal beta-1,3-N-acetylglucosaminyltransferase-like protein 1 n=1 Tax=Teleopsis dalmanni TaxID=139649 RepID=UPI0018CFCE59|nr:UDP-GlcNAc:betaGal beta-1,3-N-acetylglucosaminyltransferase-like protein 1 [Teleopsis dalmanni]
MPEDIISIIITILNGAKWIDNCFESILKQTAVQKQQQQQQQLQTQYSIRTAHVTSHNNQCENVQLEVCAFDDCSTDNTVEILKLWRQRFKNVNVPLVIIRNESEKSKGVGYGRNAAIANSTGTYLCFQDVDDIMLPNRILKQYALAKRHQDAIIGSKFMRIPTNSTCRFSKWANDLDPQKLTLQIYTSNGPTVIMPTWFCHRSVYNNISNGFCDDGHGIPEDLIFFYKHLDRGGSVLRVDQCLLKYRYHPEATTFSIAAKTILRIRLRHLIENILQKEPWSNGFTIWNAGKQGKTFFRDLPAVEKHKVISFCDVDKKKIQNMYKYFDQVTRKITHTIPVLHFTQAKPPLVICMKLDMTNGAFEANLRSLNLTEGTDYILFT